MPEAARIEDNIEHTFALLGLIVGAIAGAVIGALVVVSGGAAALAIAAAAASGASLGSMLLEFIGSLLPGFTTGKITGICSPNVIIGSKMAARATADFSMCSGIIVSHPSSLIAQGSKTVQINGLPAARKTDKLVCGASISSGCDTVLIGEEAGTFLEIDSEVPAWLEYSMIVLGVVGGAGLLRLGVFGAPLAWRGVGQVLGYGFLGSYAGGAFASWFGAGLFGEGSKGQRIMGFVGSLLGGFYAGGRAYRGAPREYNLTPGIDTGQDILIGQRAVSPTFSKGGKFKGKSLEEVAADLKSGKLDPADIEVEYIWVNGEKVAVNNRSRTVLADAGKKPVNVKDITGKLPSDGPDSLKNVLKRLDEMGGKPSRQSNIRSGDDWDSPIAKTVDLGEE